LDRRGDSREHAGEWSGGATTRSSGAFLLPEPHGSSEPHGAVCRPDGALAVCAREALRTARGAGQSAVEVHPRLFHPPGFPRRLARTGVRAGGGELRQAQISGAVPDDEGTTPVTVPTRLRAPGYAPRATRPGQKPRLLPGARGDCGLNSAGTFS